MTSPSRIWKGVHGFQLTDAFARKDLLLAPVDSDV